MMKRKFIQNHGMEHAESVIYVTILKVNDEEQVCFLNCMLTPVDSTVNTLKIELIFISAFMLVLSLLLAFAISNQISKSMIRVSDSAKELAQGDYDVVFEGKDYKEIAELSNTLNYMAKELGKTEAIRLTLERYNKLTRQDGYQMQFIYDRDAWIMADAFKINQVIYNLVNNAIHYTGEDKKVVVRQILEDGRVRVEISDSGEGIKNEDLPYIWERYYKVDKTHKRSIKGTGFGLAIVKYILELHQVQYGVETQLGKGSTFWFEFKEEVAL